MKASEIYKYRNLFLLAGILTGIPLSFLIISQNFVSALNIFFNIHLNVEFWGFGLQHFGIEILFLCGVLLGATFIPLEKKFLFFILSVIFLFFVFLLRYSVNIPITDDYFEILSFSNSFYNSISPDEKISMFFSFNNENRIVVLRLIILILQEISGVINFKILIVFSGLGLPLILFLFNKTICFEILRLEIILILSIFVFHFGFYDSVLWLIPAMHYKILILCLMFALFSLNMKSPYFQILALFFAVFSVFTCGNGWLVFYVAMANLVVKRNWKPLILWVVVGIGLAIPYFQGFPMVHKEISFQLFVNSFLFSCCFLGSAFQFMYWLPIPFCFGLIIWLFFGFLTFKKYYKKNFPIYGLMLFVLLSSLTASHFRTIGDDLSVAISNRYGFFSLMVFSASLIALFEIIKEESRKKLILPALILSIAYHLLTGVFFFPEVPVRKQKLESFIRDIKNNNLVIPSPPAIPTGADNIVREAIRNKIYYPD